MKSPYTLASEELAEIRRQNAEELERRKDFVRKNSPEYNTVERQLASSGVALALCVLEGGNSLAEIRRRIENAQADKTQILKGLALPDNYLDEIFTCKNCRDTGFDKDGRRCQCFKTLISKHVGANSNLTEAMRAQTFDSYDFSLFEGQPDIKGHSMAELSRMAFNKARDLAENFEVTHGNLYFYGSSGTGKTYLSSCIANRVLERGYTVYYKSAFGLLDMLEKLKFGRYDEDELASAEYEAKYVYDVDLLIIDDMGTEFITAYSSSALFDIINSRLNNGKSTVISSNLGPVKISETYGGRMASRIAGAYTAIPFGGRDLRITL